MSPIRWRGSPVNVQQRIIPFRPGRCSIKNTHSLEDYFLWPKSKRCWCFEHSENWTIRLFFEDWIADRTLSKRKTAFQQTTHTQMRQVLENDACMGPKLYLIGCKWN